jgi:hypothetical protein
MPGIKKMRGVIFKKGQSLTEVALLIALVGLAFVGMQLYIKRGVQSRIKSLADGMITGNVTVDADGKAVLGTRTCPEQSTYAEDTTGLNVSESDSSVIFGSTAVANESPGGGKSLGTAEDSTTGYESVSEGSIITGE